MIPTPRRTLRGRKRADRTFALCGAGAVFLVVLWIAFLFASLVVRALPAMTNYEVRLAVDLNSEMIPPDNPRRGNWRGVLQESIAELLEQQKDSFGRENLPQARTASKWLLSKGAAAELRRMTLANPNWLDASQEARTQSVFLPVSDPLDQYAKGLLAPSARAGALLTPAQAEFFDHLRSAGVVKRKFAWRFFSRADSRFPALAGIAGAIKGSLLAILVCLLLSFPVGVAAAVWFEDFAPEGKRTDLFRINVYNLAAVPSIIFGLLGLAVFLNFFEMPRGSPLVGGMVLALMTLPTVIVVAASALRAVPSNLREAALALGASRQEAMLHHILPYALPGILTGTIIGLARAFGETAPLLLIGMSVFLTSVPEGVTSPATALPAQIFLWADQPERGFAARASAAIVALLLVLTLVNMTAILLRERMKKDGADESGKPPRTRDLLGGKPFVRALRQGRGSQRYFA